MTEESMAWLGVALWLTEFGFTSEDAALCATSVVEVLSSIEEGN